MCVSPRVRHYYDPFSGERRTVQYPCGHCADCLRAFQDSVAIRVEETAKNYSSFIYDTLTFRDSSMQWLDVSDALTDPRFFLHGAARYYLDSFYPYGEVPVFDKKVFSMWLKQGRELYNYHHRKAISEGRMSRLHIKYVCCMEYGPKTSRPHAHLVMFGISHADYVRFFAKPWRAKYGFTKTKFIDSKNPKFERNGKLHSHQQDVQCISRYISKYVSKGTFESPLVLNGLQPKPWRAFSHGIGEEYLFDNPRYSFLNTPICAFMRMQHGVITEYRWDEVYSRKDNSWSAGWLRLPESGHGLSFAVNFSLTPSQVTSLTTYYDSHGFPHALPRYYREKLLGRDSNLLKYEVQNSLLSAAEQRSYKEISEFASNLGCRLPDKPCTSSDLLELLRSTYPLVYQLYMSSKKTKARFRCEGSQIRLKNHYTRSYLCEDKTIQ